MRRLQYSRISSWLAAFAAMLLSVSLTRTVHAVPVRITAEGLEGIEVAQRDLAGNLRFYQANDDDADGMISVVADLDLVSPTTYQMRGVFVTSYSVNGSGLDDSGSVPHLITGTDERVITDWRGLPTIPFTLGQQVSVAGGSIPGLDAVVYLSPGPAIIDSAADVVDLDLTTLPLYTGPLEVGGLVHWQVVPEPSTFALASLGLLSLGVYARRVARTNVRVAVATRDAWSGFVVHG